MSNFQDIEIGDLDFVGENFRVVKGANNEYPIIWRDSNNVTKDLTGWRAIFTVVRIVKGRRTEVMTFDSGDGEIIVSNGSSDIDGANIRIVMSKSKLDTLPVRDDYLYDLYVIEGGQSVGKYLLEGSLEVRQERTKIIVSQS